MRGTMMDFPLTLQLIFDRGTRPVPRSGNRHGRLRPARTATRIASSASASIAWPARSSDLGLEPGERVATFSWNHYRHLELYFAVPMLGAVLHTLNIRLFHDQLTYIVNHAADRFIVVDRSLLPVDPKLAADV